MDYQRSPAKFLLVDDLDANLALLEDALCGPGLELLRARSGPEALALLEAHEVALAIIDVQMPGMDGFELAERMRAAERTKRIPIIFLTAGARDSEKVFAGYEAGAVDFLFKPLNTEILKHKTNTFLELYEQRRRLTDTLRLHEEMLAVVSHDLRTPLSAILMAAEIVRTSTQEPIALKAAARIESSGKRMLRIIQDLLDLSRARLGAGIPIERGPVDLVALAKKAAEEVEAATPNCRIEVEGEQAVEGLWDAARLEQVVVNLLTNAVSHGSGPVGVGVRRASEQAAALSVQNGGFIEAGMRSTLFEAFQERPDRQGREGLGLGLYIVEQIVRAHGGTVKVTSTPDAGTTFEVTLPLAPAAPS
jgi:signal transduction histidine kinase